MKLEALAVQVKVANVLAAVLLLWCLVTSSNSAVVIHPNFKGSGQKEGIEIWRIENNNPVPLPKTDYGKFHEEDTYIVMSTKEEKSGKLRFIRNIHYWVGKSTVQDEYGAVAVLSVTLDVGCTTCPGQHREVQEHESEQFLEYFPSGVRYLPGGVASGFNHTDINAPGQKRLYQVKGKKNVRVSLVPLDAKSLNEENSFILDAGKEIYVWVSTQVKETERLKAIRAANQIRDQDHNGSAKVTVVDSSSTNVEVNQFFKELGSEFPSQVSNGPSTGDDQEFEKKQDVVPRLYKLSDARGKIVSEELTEKPLTQSMLKTEDCFILDTVTSGIYIWIGQNSTSKQKLEALARGRLFLRENNYPQSTQIHRIVEGDEPTAFKEYFDGWTDITEKPLSKNDFKGLSEVASFVISS